MADPRSYRIQDPLSPDDALDYDAMVTVSWDDLAAVNDPEVMEEIALLEVGQATVLGMCDPIERVS